MIKKILDEIEFKYKTIKYRKPNFFTDNSINLRVVFAKKFL